MIDTEQHEESYLDSTDCHSDKSSYALIDQYRDIGVSLISEKKSNIWHLPIYTVSLSESGFEKVYQGTTVLNQFNLFVSKEPVILKFSLVTGTEKDIQNILHKSETVKSI